MLEDALDVHGPAVRARQRPHGDDVHGDRDERDDQHEDRVDVVRVHEPRYRLDHEDDREHREDRAVDRGAERLDPPEAVGHRAARRARGEAQRHEAEHDRARVGEHVPGIREQGDGAGDQADDDLRHHQAADQRQRDEQRPAVRLGRDRVVMVVAVARHRPVRVVSAEHAFGRHVAVPARGAGAVRLRDRTLRRLAHGCRALLDEVSIDVMGT